MSFFHLFILIFFVTNKLIKRQFGLSISIFFNKKLLLYARHPPHLQMSLFGATLKASWCFLPISAACVHNGEVFGFCWIFFLLFSLLSLSSPCQNIKVSFNLFFVFILVLVLLISICFIFLYLFLINFLFNFTPHYLISFSFNLYIKLSPRSFD